MSDIFRIFKTVVKSLFTKSACDMYPFKAAKFYDKTRGRITFENKQCTFCSLCSMKCPTSAIVIDKESKRWGIDHYKCIFCGACIDNCRLKCLKMVNQYPKPSEKKQIEYFDVK